MTDWLDDPLMVFDQSTGYLVYKKIKDLDDIEAENWKVFHHATRTKLEGAVHFCTQLLGAANLNYDLGLPSLIYSQRKWYADAFFFELCSAYDTLLQEINLIYKCNLKEKDVNWKKIDPKLPSKLASLMKEVRDTDWFKKVRLYRNTATHQIIIPMGQTAIGTSESKVLPWDMQVESVSIFYIDEKTNNPMGEDIAMCKEYLKKFLQHINEVWYEVAKEKATSLP